MNGIKALIGALAITGLFFGYCRAADDPASLAAERRLWNRAVEMQAEDENRGAVLHHPQIDAFLNTVVQRLWQQVDSSLPRPIVRIILDSRVTAQAYPNGVCDLSSGMLAHLDNEDQLAMIMAHEMVHYLQRHTLRAFGYLNRSFSKNNEYEIDAKYSEKEAVPISKFVNAAEQQADLQGLAIMRAAGYCPAEALQLLVSFLSSAGTSVQELQSDAAIRDRMGYVRELLSQRSELRPCHVSDSAHQFFVSQIAPVFLANAKTAVKQGDWEQAQASIRKYLDYDPQDARGYFVLGQIRAHQQGADKLAQALAAYQQAINLDHDFADAHREIGALFFKTGQKERARGHFERSLSLAPDDVHNAYIREYLRLCLP